MDVARPDTTLHESIGNNSREFVGAWISEHLDVINDLVETESVFEMREYQLEAWEALWQARQNGADRALIHLATGLGKTRTATLDAAKFEEEFTEQTGRLPKIMFVSHQTGINEQAAQDFSHFMPASDQGLLNKHHKDTSKQLTFATFQSLRRHLPSLAPDTFDYIIYDEAHHAQADTYKDVVEHFQPTFKVGITATPNREDGRDIRELFGEEVFSVGLPEAIAEGWLAKIDYHIVFDNALKRAMQSGFRPETLQELNAMFDAAPRSEEIVKNIQQEIERLDLKDAKTIVFCQTIDHAEEIAQLLGAVSYHSKQTDQEQRDTMANFRTGNLQIICTRDMFNEGVDIPDARLLVFLRSTQSSTVFEQQLGRGLRKTAGKDNVTVLDFVANIQRLVEIKAIRDEVATHIQKRNPNAEVEEDDEGFGLRSSDATFDFDRLTVDALELLREIQDMRSSSLSQLNNDQLVTIALQLSPEAPLSTKAIQQLSSERGFISVGHIQKRFGSIRDFQEACGFDVSSLTDLGDEELIALALQMSPERPLSYEQIKELSRNDQFVSVPSLSKRFGGVRGFQKACGFEIRDLAALSNDEIIAIAQELKPDSWLTLKELNALSRDGVLPSSGTLEKKFGSMGGFREACGYPAVVQESQSHETIIATALAISPDKPLSDTAIKKLVAEGRFPGGSTILKKFGGIIEFQRACGFDVKPFSEKTNEELIDLARELSPDAPLTIQTLTELSKDKLFVGIDSVRKRFGSIPEFQEACGFTRIKVQQKTAEQLIHEALELSPEAPLSADDIRQLSKLGQLASTGTIQKHFGSITSFQKSVWGKTIPRKPRT